jgi:hypothetical protein
VRGIAVHVAARVATLAEPSECLVTRTVKDLVAGADISFLERGKRDLRGIAEALDLFAGALLSATVEDATAQKQMDFEVDQTLMGMYPFRSVLFNLKRSRPTEPGATDFR